MAYQQNLKGAENGKNAFSFSAGILMRTCGMLHSTTINSRKKKAKKKAIPTSVWLELFQQRMCRIYTSLAEEKKLLKA